MCEGNKINYIPTFYYNNKLFEFDFVKFFIVNLVAVEEKDVRNFSYKISV